MPLTFLDITDTPVADLSPLDGMELKDIKFSPKRIVKGIEGIRSMRTLKVIGWDSGRLSRDEFWKKYDAGEFK